MESKEDVIRFSYTWTKGFNLLPIVVMLQKRLSQDRVLRFLAGQAKKDFSQLSQKALFSRWGCVFPSARDHQGEMVHGDERPMLSCGEISPLSAAEWLAMIFNSGKLLGREHCMIALAYVLGRGVLEENFIVANGIIKALESNGEEHLADLLHRLLYFVQHGEESDVFCIENYPE